MKPGFADFTGSGRTTELIQHAKGRIQGNAPALPNKRRSRRVTVGEFGVDQRREAFFGVNVTQTSSEAGIELTTGHPSSSAPTGIAFRNHRASSPGLSGGSTVDRRTPRVGTVDAPDEPGHDAVVLGAPLVRDERADVVPNPDQTARVERILESPSAGVPDQVRYKGPVSTPADGTDRLARAYSTRNVPPPMRFALLKARRAHPTRRAFSYLLSSTPPNDRLWRTETNPHWLCDGLVRPVALSRKCKPGVFPARRATALWRTDRPLIYWLNRSPSVARRRTVAAGGSCLSASAAGSLVVLHERSTRDAAGWFNPRPARPHGERPDRSPATGPCFVCLDAEGRKHVQRLFPAGATRSSPQARAESLNSVR